MTTSTTTQPSTLFARQHTTPGGRHINVPTDTPTLRFTPGSWAKLHHLAHLGDTEIAGFGLADVDDPLLVRDFITIEQKADFASVCFDDDAVAELFDRLVDAGYKPHQFARLWIHTHPGDSPEPSGTDEETFERVFGPCDWAVMGILARGGNTYARLRFNVGPGGSMQIPVLVDWSQPFAGSDHEAWQQEYGQHVKPVDGRRVPVLGEDDLEPLDPDEEHWLAQHLNGWFADSTEAFDDQ